MAKRRTLLEEMQELREAVEALKMEVVQSLLWLFTPVTPLKVLFWALCLAAGIGLGILTNGKKP